MRKLIQYFIGNYCINTQKSFAFKYNCKHKLIYIYTYTRMRIMGCLRVCLRVALFIN